MTTENTISHKSAIERPRSWWVLNNDAKVEKVEHERFHWVAVYRDGEELRQFQDGKDPDDGIYHRFNEIELDKLAEIHIHDTERPEFLYVIRIEQTQQPFMIYRTRRIVEIGSKTEVKQIIRFAIVGWKDRESGAMLYTYIMPDGAIVSADKDIQIK